jgi:hypothetical protein
MSGEEFGGAHAASALGLDDTEAECILAAGDEDTGRGDIEDAAGVPRRGWDRFGFPDFEEEGVGLVREMGEGAGPGEQGAGLAPELVGGPGPIDAGIVAGDFACVGCVGEGLCLGGELTGGIGWQGFEEELGADLGEAIVKGEGVVGIVDGSGALAEDGAGVEAVVEFHDGDTGFWISVEDGPLNGSGTTVLGQERGMDVQEPEWSRVKEVLGQDLAVSHDNADVRVERANGLDEGGIAGPFGLVQGQPELESEGFDGGWLQAEFAASGAVGLRDDGEELVIWRMDQCFE